MMKILLVIWIISFGFISSNTQELSELNRSKELAKTDELINSSANSKSNIHQFSKEVVCFDQAYTASHVCYPSQVSFLNGKNLVSIDLTDFLPDRREPTFQQWNNADIYTNLPFEEITLLEALREYGYRTGTYGKWHLGEDPSGLLEHGFDVGNPTDWNWGWPKAGFFYPSEMGGLGGGEGDYLTVVLTNEEVKFIKKNKDSPFFLYLSLSPAHDSIKGSLDVVENFEVQLLNVKSGPAGKNNLSDKRPEKVQELKYMLHTWQKKVRANIPSKTLYLVQGTKIIGKNGDNNRYDDSLTIVKNRSI